MPTHIVSTPLFLPLCVDNLNMLGFIDYLDKGKGEENKIEQNVHKISLFLINSILSFLTFLNPKKSLGFSIYREGGFGPLGEYFEGLLKLINSIFNFYVQFLKTLFFFFYFF